MSWHLPDGAAALIPRGHSLMVKFQPSKLAMRVRFPLPAHFLFPSQTDMNKCRWTFSNVLTHRSDQTMASITKDTHTGANIGGFRCTCYAAPLCICSSPLLLRGE